MLQIEIQKNCDSKSSQHKYFYLIIMGTEMITLKTIAVAMILLPEGLRQKLLAQVLALGRLE